ncbi:MAG: hypothetical protein ABL885_07635 [Methylophilaceae bacterium]
MSLLPTLRCWRALWVFLSMLEIMEADSQEKLGSLKQTAHQFLGKVV